MAAPDSPTMASASPNLTSVCAPAPSHGAPKPWTCTDVPDLCTADAIHPRSYPLEPIKASHASASRSLKLTRRPAAVP